LPLTDAQGRPVLLEELLADARMQRLAALLRQAVR